MVDYNKRLVEVDEILNYLSEDDLQKIPEDIRNAIKEKKDKEYAWKYDETKPLKEQNLSRDTIVILSYLNIEFLLNEEQKELMHQIHALNEKKAEEKKKEMYSADNLFKNKKQENVQNEQPEENSLIESKKENIFVRIISRIKNLFLRTQN